MDKKDIKNFFKYFFLILCIYFINETLKKYLVLDFTQKYSWAFALGFAFLFYLISEGKLG